MKKYGYVYHTYCLPSRKHYIGRCKSGVFKPEYHGSGERLKLALNKYGESSFVTVPLVWAEWDGELNALEIQIIKMYRERYGEKEVYNLSNGGDAWMSGRHHTVLTKKRISIGSKNTWRNQRIREIIIQKHTGRNHFAFGKPRPEDVRKKISRALLGNVPWNKGLKGIWHHTAKTRKQMCDSQAGQTWKKSEEFRATMRAVAQKRDHSVYKKTWVTRKLRYGGTGGNHIGPRMKGVSA